MKDVVVIGGGIAGLTTAFYLKQQGLDVSLFEADERPGGLIATRDVDGFLLELGPNSSLRKPALEELANDLQIAAELCLPAPTARSRYLAVCPPGATKPELSKVPTGLLQAAATPILSQQAKIRALAEVFLPRAAGSANLEDQSVAQFIAQRFGEEVAANVVAPMLGGIWAADIAALSARSALPRLWEISRENRSLLLGLLRARRAKKKTGEKAAANHKGNHTGNHIGLTTFRGGMGFLPAALAESLGESLTLGTRVERIARAGADYRVWTSTQVEGQPFPSRRNPLEEVFARQVVLAVGAKPAARLLAEHAPALARGIAAVPHAPLGVLHLGIEKSSVGHPLDGFGFLAQPRANLATLGCIFSSALFPGRAPDDCELLTCFVGGSSRPQFADVRSGDIQRLVAAEVSELLALRRKPAVLSATYYPAAIPNYPLGHHQLQRGLDDFERDFGGCYVLGNWRKGLSVTDRIEEGMKTAAQAVARASGKRAAVNRRSAAAS